MIDKTRPNHTIEELLRLGQIGLEQGYWRDAERNFDLVLEQAPRHLDAMLGKARAIRDVGKALHWAQHAQLLWPDNPDAAALVAQLEQQSLATSREESQEPTKPVSVSQGRRPVNMAWRWLLVAAPLVVGLSLWFIWPWVAPARWDRNIPAVTITVAPLAETEGMATPLWVAPTPHPGMARAQSATVLVLVPERDSDQVSRGSGILFDQQGLVLTNQHVLTTATGQYLNIEKAALVGFARDERRAPDVWYIATVMAADGAADLAVLRLIATSEGQPIADVPFEPIAWGNSDDLVLGQDLIGLGFPSLGGDTLTYAKGSVAGFLLSPEGIEMAKTEANLLPGGSGGPVVLMDGHLIGVVSTAYTDERTQGRLSYLTLLSEADAVVAQGRRVAWSTPDIAWLSDQAQRVIQGQR